MPYAAVIFDLDGTIVDSSEGIIKAVEEAINILDYPVMTHDEIRSYIGPPIGNAIIERNGYDEKDLEEFNNIFREIYKNKYLMNVKVYEGMIELLSDLKNRTFVGISTNKRIDYTTTMLNNLDLSQFCDSIEGLDMDNKLNKTDLIQRCVKTFNITMSEQIVMVGDTNSDALAAKECGIDFIGVTFGFGFKRGEDLPYGRAVDDVETLRNILLD